MRNRGLGPVLLLLALCVVLFLIHLLVGSVEIPASTVWSGLVGGSSGTFDRIIRDVRLPGAITSLVAGGGLAASGLLMQTLFRNPLAGPSVMGLSSGASLGVALLMLAQPLWKGLPVPHDLALVIASMAGSVLVLLLILLADRRLGDAVTLLIVGLMVGYLCSALISVLQVASPAAALKGFVLWGMGSFSGVGLDRLPWLVVPVLLGLLGALLLVKPLNALLLGTEQAASLGVDVPATRQRVMWITGILAGTVTAFCGPIAFLGLATPHVARGLLRTSDHAPLMPVTMLLGACLALFCDILCRLPSVGGALPLNAVTSLLGAPVVVWVLLHGKRWSRAA